MTSLAASEQKQREASSHLHPPNICALEPDSGKQRCSNSGTQVSHYFASLAVRCLSSTFVPKVSPSMSSVAVANTFPALTRAAQLASASQGAYNTNTSNYISHHYSPRTLPLQLISTTHEKTQHSLSIDFKCLSSNV